MEKFSSIGRFRNVVTGVSRYSHDRGLSLPTYDYIGTVKLHGINAGIRRTASGKIVPQSRSRILDISSDNYGFAMFVQSNLDAITNLFDKFRPLLSIESDIITFSIGELSSLSSDFPDKTPWAAQA